MLQCVSWLFTGEGATVESILLDPLQNAIVVAILGLQKPQRSASSKLTASMSPQASMKLIAYLPNIFHCFELLRRQNQI